MPSRPESAHVCSCFQFLTKQWLQCSEEAKPHRKDTRCILPVGFLPTSSPAQAPDKTVDESSHDTSHTLLGLPVMGFSPTIASNTIRHLQVFLCQILCSKNSEISVDSKPQLSPQKGEGRKGEGSTWHEEQWPGNTDLD